MHKLRAIAAVPVIGALPDLPNLKACVYVAQIKPLVYCPARWNDIEHSTPKDPPTQAILAHTHLDMHVNMIQNQNEKNQNENMGQSKRGKLDGKIQILQWCTSDAHLDAGTLSWTQVLTWTQVRSAGHRYAQLDAGTLTWTQVRSPGRRYAQLSEVMWSKDLGTA